MHRLRAHPARLALLLSALITIGYGVLAVGILDPDAVYSIDAAIKYVQARSLLAHGFSAMPIENRAAYIDPSGDFMPFPTPLVFTREGTMHAIYSTAGALLFAPWSQFGIGALAWPALLGAGALLFLTCRFAAETPAGWALPGVLGVATTLWFYAVQPGEHTIAVALTTGALLTSGSPTASSRRLVLAGALLGLAAVIRDEAILIVPGVLITRWLAGVRGRALLREWLIVGAVVLTVLATMAAVDTILFDRPPGAHLRHAMPMLRDYLEPEEGLVTLHTMSWRERYETLVEYWLLGRSEVGWAALLLITMAAGVWLRYTTGSALLLLAAVGGVLVSAVLEIVAPTPPAET